MSDISITLTEAEVELVSLALTVYAADQRVGARLWEGCDDPKILAARETALGQVATADAVWERIRAAQREAQFIEKASVQTGG